MKAKKANLLQGTLDLLVLKALPLRALHGLGDSSRIEQITKGV
jgi:PadR family transcriptional regulator, regulatory protein PadR